MVSFIYNLSENDRKLFLDYIKEGIDPDNFRINYVENPKDYFGNCNFGGLETVTIYPVYIRN